MGAPERRFDDLTESCEMIALRVCPRASGANAARLRIVHSGIVAARNRVLRPITPRLSFVDDRFLDHCKAAASRRSGGQAHAITCRANRARGSSAIR